MKALNGFFLFSGLSILIISANVSANGGEYTAQIQSAQMDDSPGLVSANLESGEIKIDFNSNEVVLKVQKKSECAAGTTCTNVVPSPTEIHLPIVSQQEQDCGIRQLTAANQEASIIIHDNSHYNCPNYILLPQTVANYQTHRSTKGQISFTASTLQEIIH